MHGALGEQRLGDVARRRELGAARRVELERAIGRIGGDRDLGRALRAIERRVGGPRQVLEQREIGERRPARIRRGSPACGRCCPTAGEGDDKADADDQRPGNQHVGGELIDLAECSG